jgi:Icc-related predicted phosphoesterase
VTIYVVSDLHGATDELAAALPGDAQLLLLGDLINLLDYTTKTGILYEVFSVEAVERVSSLRARGEFEEATRVIRERAVGKHDLRGEISRRVEDQYAEVFSILPDPTYLITGNVDSPDEVARLAAGHPGVHLADGRVVTLSGERFGFVGGALPTPFGAAGEVNPERLAATVSSLGKVDILCSHIPPAVPELCFDTLAGRPEAGSRDLLAYIEDVQPRRAYFGHVHQPLVSSMYVGRTLCINVGYFRATGRAWVHHQ